MNAAIVFEPDGYVVEGAQILGRRVAGEGFLRAAVAARGDAPLAAFTPHQRSAQIFEQVVRGLDPAARTAWIPAHRLDLVAQHGVLYRPDQILGPTARQRLRAGPAAYSLCGITHTLSTSGTLDAIAKMLTEPVMPWDALVCASTAAKAVVEAVLDHQADYLAWRTGHPAPAHRPMLPLIPLGVHCDDFAFAADERAAARAALGLADDEVAVIFAARFSTSGKAHPFATFSALQAVRRDTGRPVVLVLAGYSFSPESAALLNSGLADFCPDVRVVRVDGRDPPAYRQAWVGADIFISLADSIQESFGITPIEAMAAGLPALVSDWDGYRDGVRDGVDGFRIRTWAPAPGAGASAAEQFESGALSYDRYLSRNNTAVAVDLDALVRRLRELVLDADLRRRFGDAGRRRAREMFDWSVVFRAYRALWDEQRAMRARALDDPATQGWLARAPRTGSDHMGPFDTFASFPTAPVDAATRVIRGGNGDLARHQALASRALTAQWVVPEPIVERMLTALGGGEATVGELAAATGLAMESATEIVARLAKIGVLALDPQPPGDSAASLLQRRP
jgi:glycosyltransferase involved in cell wall biosynthesis